MRTANRKVNRQPVRSPSPDIASKNKITNTVAPLSEVLKKSRINSHASMPLELGMSSLEDLHRAVVDWQERYKILERQLNNLLLENSALKKEIIQLQQLLAKNKPLFNEPIQPDINIKEYQSRLSRLMDEISRIQDLLYHQKEKNQYLQSENQRLRFGKGSRAQSSEQVNRNLSYIEQNLNLSFERMKAELELKVRLSFNTLSERFANIESTQLELENMIVKSQFTTPKVIKGHRSNGMSTTSAYHSPSPSDSKKFSRKSLPKVQEREHTIEQLSLENTRLRETLERQRQRSMQCINCKIYLRKISDLQAIIGSMNRQKTHRVSEREQSIKNELQLQHQRFNFNLEDYLRRIREVKTILNNQQFRQFIQKINEVINENTHLHHDFNQLHQDRDRIEKQLNQKEIEHKIIVNSLRSQNESLKMQVIEQQKQLAKLEEIIQTQKKAERVQKMGTYKGSRSQTDSKAFQRYIEEAIFKLQSLQQSMESTLRE